MIEHVSLGKVFCVIGELFALRVDDVEPRLLKIDEALKETADRIGGTKTESSDAYVSISEDLQKEITTWLSIRNMADPYHRKPRSLSE